MGWSVVCGCGISWSHLPFGFFCFITGQIFCELDSRLYEVDLKHFIPEHELFHKSTEQQNILIIFYRLTGCDTCNAFYGTGKRLAHREMCRMPKSFKNYVSNLPALNL